MFPSPLYINTTPSPVLSHSSIKHLFSNSNLVRERERKKLKMICLYAETHLSSFAVFFYSCVCVCVPFVQSWRAVVRLWKFVVDPHHQAEDESSENPKWELDVPVSQYEKKVGGDEEEMCSICLVELEEEDWVNKLPKCGHLFHAECLDRWLDRCHFTCPLCRSSLLRFRSCKSTPPPFCIDLHASSLNLQF